VVNLKKALLVMMAALLLVCTGQLALAVDFQAETATLSGGAVVEGNYVKLTQGGGKITFNGLPSGATKVVVHYRTTANANANFNFNGQWNANVNNSLTDTTVNDPKGSYSKTTYYISLNTIYNGQAVWIDKISVNTSGTGDTVAPTVTLTAPASNATVSGSVTISAVASDNVGVSRVEFYYGTTLIATDDTAPYSVTWDTTTVANGTYNLTAKAYDTSGNVQTSAARRVTVNNQSGGDTIAPTVALTAPAAGATVSGNVTVSATASDNVGVSRVEFYYGTTLIATDDTAPYSVTWDTTTVANGSYSLTAKAYDAAGNVGTSAARSVTVNNATATGLKVHFKNNSFTNWSTFNCYFWNSNGSPQENTWPGQSMTAEGNNWYLFVVPGASSANVIFNNGSAQTVDLSRTGEGWWVPTGISDGKIVGVWYDTNPDGDVGDTVAPTVALTAPAAGATVSGNVTVSATASDNVGVSRVEFYYGTNLIATDDTAPYSVTWNTTAVANGSYSLTAKAYDVAGNVGTSAAVSVTVQNEPSQGFTVYFKKPADWADTVHIYIWQTPGANTAGWPGNPMIPAPEEDAYNDEEGRNWFKYNVTCTGTANIIFNQGNSQKQTGDLTRNKQGYYKDGTWYDENPDISYPVISAQPKPGQYDRALDVVLTSTKTDDQIYYTFDASLPKDSWTLYTGPIHLALPSNTTISAYGINNRGLVGEVASFTYDIGDYDLVNPTILGNPSSGWSKDPITVSFTIIDNKPAVTTAYYTTDGSTPTTSSPIYVSGNAVDGLTGPQILVNETTTFSFLVVDGAGRQHKQIFTYNIGERKVNDFREETIYFLMTARFYDGDPDNNRPTRCYESSGNAQYNDPAWRGDFKGLIEKLDYIKALGFSAIWITPPVLNRSDYDYHGYHAWDMTKIDGRLESPGYDYQRLINEAHARGIKVIQDIVLNHSGRFGLKGQCEVKYWGNRNDPQWGVEGMNFYDEYNPDFEYDGVSIEPLSGHSYYNGDLWTYEKPNLPWEGVDEYQWWPGGYGGLVSHKNDLDNLWNKPSPYSSPEGYKVWHFQWPGMYESQFSLLDPEWFHCYWLKNWEDYTCQYGTIHEDCLDLDTESPVVQQYLVDAYSKYIQMGVDGFRIDTVKHINRNTFNRRFIPAFQAAAEAAGNPYFFMFGEVCVRDHGVWNKGNVSLSVPFYTWKERTTYSEDDKIAAWECYNYETNLMGPDNQPISDNHLLHGNDYHEPNYSQYSGMSVIDFRMHWNFINASTAFGVRDGDKYFNDATWNVTYVESHDYSPVEGGNNTYLRYITGDAQATATSFAENWNLMFTWRGIPCIFYGNEILFKSGAIIDVGPNMPLEETGRAYFGNHLEGTISGVTDFGRYESATGELANTLNHPLAKHVRKLNIIRRSIPALQKGQYSTENVSGNIAFKRRYTAPGVDSFVLVTISGDATFTSIPNGTYVDAITGDVKVVTNGTLTASCSGKGNMRIYVLDTPETPAPGQIAADIESIWLK